MTFRIGQKVVCVDDQDRNPRRGDPRGWDNRLRKGQTYIIRWVGKSGVKVQGINRRRSYEDVDYSDGAFYPDRFRPLIKRKTDIGFAILEEIRQRESEPAPPRKVRA